MTVETDAAALAEARLLRHEARALVQADIATLRDALTDRPIGQRIKERAAHEAAEAIDQARDIASENKAIIAVVAAAIAGWLMRGPIGALIAALAGADTQGEDHE